jgi:hypothetical protein
MSKKKEPYEKLYRAVAAYVEAQGGSVLIADGIQILRWPGDAANKFTLCVSCFGRQPKFAKLPK